MEYKTCTKCGTEKAEQEFYTYNRGGTKKYGNICKPCYSSQKIKRAREKGIPERVLLFNDGISKECGKCGLIKPHSEFASKGGKPSYRCKQCHNQYYKEYWKKTEAYQKHRSRVRRPSRPRYSMHGLTEEQFNELKTLDGLCPICNTRSQQEIDHDHSCCPGQTSCGSCVRGYICGSCNRALGNINDSKDVLRKMIQYLS